MKDYRLIPSCDYETRGHQTNPRRAAVCTFSDRFYGWTRVRDTASGPSVYRTTLDRYWSETQPNHRNSRRNRPRLSLARGADRGCVNSADARGKAALSRRTPKPAGFPDAHSERGSVLECGTPVPLWSCALEICQMRDCSRVFGKAALSRRAPKPAGFPDAHSERGSVLECGTQFRFRPQTGGAV
jgi:hypothetical protein